MPTPSSRPTNRHPNARPVRSRRGLALMLSLVMTFACVRYGLTAAQVDAIFDESEEIAASSGDGIVRWRHAADRAETREFCREAVTRLEDLLVRFVLPFDWHPAWRFSVPVKIHYGAEMREVGDYPYTRPLNDPRFMSESHFDPHQSAVGQERPTPAAWPERADRGHCQQPRIDWQDGTMR